MSKKILKSFLLLVFLVKSYGQNDLKLKKLDIDFSALHTNSGNLLASAITKVPNDSILQRSTGVSDCCDRIDFVFDGVYLDTWANSPGSDAWHLNYIVCLNKDFNLTATCHNATGSGITFSWIWDDGSPNSSGSNINHTFITPGIHIITVISSGSKCNTVTSQISVDVEPNYCRVCCPNDYGNFTRDGFDVWQISSYTDPVSNNTYPVCAAQINCPRPISLSVPDCIYGTITWDWGDGSSNNTGSSVTHNYAGVGTYLLKIQFPGNPGSAGVDPCSGYALQVTITVTKDDCPACCTKTKNFVTPTGYFNFTSDGASLELLADACRGSELGFSANCPYATSYLWDFGDGTQVTGPNVVHTYAPTSVLGFYWIQVIIDGPACNSLIEMIKVNVDISHCPLCCELPFVTSTGLQNVSSTGNPMTVGANACPNTMMIFNGNCPNVTNYTWNWGDGSSNSTGSPVAHAYNSSGSYAVTITPIANGCVPFPQTIVLNVSNAFCPPCCTDPFVTGNVQNLSLTNTSMVLTADACQYSPVTFTANCPGATGTAYTWSFGDGGTATGSNVSHSYSGAGTFAVTVTSPNGSGCGASVQTINLHVSNTLCEPCCQLNAIISSPDILNLVETGPGIYSAQICAGKAINFSALNCNPGVSSNYLWIFGDGGASAGVNVSHTYATAGTYALELDVSGSGCSQKQIINLTVVDCSCSGASIIGPSGSGCTDYPVALSVGGCTDPSAIYNWNFGDGTTGVGASVTHAYSGVGNYNVTLTIIHPPYAPLTISSSIQITACTTLNNCKDCVGSFSPEPGDYILSLWVKLDYPYPVSTTTFPAAKISFVGSTASYGPFSGDITKNKVIDGWQRIEEKFTVPVGATSIKVELSNSNSQYNCYFDDIRIHPVNGTMKSYVYDPITLRLATELDENNYATYFEYDEEGKLIRVKKETERGVMTIKESRNSSKK